MENKIENEEIKKESIDAVVVELMSRDLNKYLGKTQDYFEGVAKDLKEKYPEKTPEEIGDIYDEMCDRAQENKLNENDKEEARD